MDKMIEAPPQEPRDLDSPAGEPLQALTSTTEARITPARRPMPGR